MFLSSMLLRSKLSTPSRLVNYPGASRSRIIDSQAEDVSQNLIPERLAMNYVVFAIVVCSFAALLSPLRADPRYPDWPCTQPKVPELSAAAMWDGPSIDDVGTTWQDDVKVRDLVGLIGTRRTPLEAERDG